MATHACPAAETMATDASVHPWRGNVTRSYPPKGPTLAPKQGSGGLTPGTVTRNAKTTKQQPVRFKMARMRIAIVKGC